MKLELLSILVSANDTSVKRVDTEVMNKITSIFMKHFPLVEEVIEFLRSLTDETPKTVARKLEAIKTKYQELYNKTYNLNIEKQIELYIGVDDFSVCDGSEWCMCTNGSNCTNKHIKVEDFSVYDESELRIFQFMMDKS
jgi:hypothetical protein